MVNVEMKMRIPAVYVIVDPDTNEILDRMTCFNAEEAIEVGHRLATSEANGLLTLKKHKKLINRMKGYGQYTVINGKPIPIIEYVFMKDPDNIGKKFAMERKNAKRVRRNENWAQTK